MKRPDATLSAFHAKRVARKADGVHPPGTRSTCFSCGGSPHAWQAVKGRGSSLAVSIACLQDFQGFRQIHGLGNVRTHRNRCKHGQLVRIVAELHIPKWNPQPLGPSPHICQRRFPIPIRNRIGVELPIMVVEVEPETVESLSPPVLGTDRARPLSTSRRRQDRGTVPPGQRLQTLFRTPKRWQRTCPRYALALTTPFSRDNLQ